jgi:hypothetical protein
MSLVTPTVDLTLGASSSTTTTSDPSSVNVDTALPFTKNEMELYSQLGYFSRTNRAVTQSAMHSILDSRTHPTREKVGEKVLFSEVCEKFWDPMFKVDIEGAGNIKSKLAFVQCFSLYD